MARAPFSPLVGIQAYADGTKTGRRYHKTLSTKLVRGQRVGLLAVTNISSDRGCWNVTHLATGAGMLVSSVSKAKAIRIAKALQASCIPWEDLTMETAPAFCREYGRLVTAIREATA